MKKRKPKKIKGIRNWRNYNHEDSEKEKKYYEYLLRMSKEGKEDELTDRDKEELLSLKLCGYTLKVNSTKKEVKKMRKKRKVVKKLKERNEIIDEGLQTPVEVVEEKEGRSIYEITKTALLEGKDTAGIVQLILAEQPNADIKKAKRIIYTLRNKQKSTSFPTTTGKGGE